MDIINTLRHYKCLRIEGETELLFFILPAIFVRQQSSRDFLLSCVKHTR